MTQEFEIIEIRVEEGVDLGSTIKDSMLPNMVLWVGGLFNHSILCKWTTSLANSTWTLCQWKPTLMPILFVPYL